MRRVFQLLLLIFIVPASLFAQLSQLQIAGKPEKMATPVTEVQDINGRICAVIQVVSDMEGFKYDSYQGVVKMIDLRGKDIVFLSPNERVLEIYHSGYQPLKIILAETGIRLNSKQGWRITITGEIKLTQIPVVIDTYPDSVTVTIDNNDYGVGKLFMISNGNHKIQLSKKGFSTLTDSIAIDKDNSQFNFVLTPQLEMVFVNGGTFKMGQTDSDIDQWFTADEKPVHQVKVNDFYIAKYEVTFTVYDAFCKETEKGKPRDEDWGRGKRPVINVSWYDAIEFCNWLSKKHGFTPCYQINKSLKDPNNKRDYDDLKWTVTRDFSADGYRLPTEAEWEYAAKGGSKSMDYKYSGSNNADAVAWYDRNSGDRTHLVGTKQPNELGLYDMSGNVREWCVDWYSKDYYSKSSNQNPTGPIEGAVRVLRGGSWTDHVSTLYCANRDNYYPFGSFKFFGFRCVR